jgi:hypothetical protein
MPGTFTTQTEGGTEMKLSQSLSMMVLLACALVLTDGATNSSIAAMSCEAAGSIDAQVAAEAEVVGFDCSFKDYKGVKSLHFAVTVKNVSSADQRYRVNLFLDNGKAVGGLLPRKGKPPVVKPGEEASFTYPIQGMAEKAGNVTLLVKTVSQ